MQFYSVNADRSIVIHKGSHSTCRMCRQVREISDPARQLCDKCMYGETFSFAYECERCHKSQKIPHPMWLYQPAPDQFGSATWACHVGCGDYTHWRIMANDLTKVPLDHVPDSWNCREAFVQSIRELRQAGSSAEGSGSGTPAATPNSTGGGVCQIS